MKVLLAKLWKALRLPKGVQLNVMRVVQDQFLVGVTGIIFNEKKEVLLLKHTYRATPWSLPGGYIKAKEHPKEGLEREIEEECGFTVTAEERLKVRTDRESARLEFIYVGTYIGGTFRSSEEVSEAQFFSFDTLPALSKDQVLFIHKAMETRK